MSGGCEGCSGGTVHYAVCDRVFKLHNITLLQVIMVMCSIL